MNLRRAEEVVAEILAAAAMSENKEPEYTRIMKLQHHHMKEIAAHEMARVELRGKYED